MVKKGASILFLIMFCKVYSQQMRDFQKEIDSIAQARWMTTHLDLDSLASPQLIEINQNFEDTIFVNDAVLLPRVNEDLPFTPFALMNNDVPKRWFFGGQNNLVFNQSSFSNWNTGGNNNIGVIGKINYILGYRNWKHYYDNNIQLGYGFVASKGQSTRKTEDYINLMSNYGYDLGQDFYLSTGFQFLSQFTKAYDYAATPNPEPEDRISTFMAPGYLNVGLGISYNPNEKFQVIFRPINGKFTFVLDELLQKKGRYGLEKDGQSVRSELGAMLNILYRLKLHKNITFDNQVNFFSNYLYHTERVDMLYMGMLTIRFNKFINTLVSLDLLYDHDQIQRLQVKQTLGVGFSYSFGENKSEHPEKKKVIKPFIENRIFK